VGHVVHFGASMMQNIGSLFFVLGWDRCGFLKKRVRTSYVELVFLYLVGSVSQVVHCGASGARNIDTLFFLLVWDRYGFSKSASGHVTPNLSFCIQ
jgi:hypothetical protein